MTKLYGPRGNEVQLENYLRCVGEGWQPIVQELVKDLLNIGWDGHLFQVKEKFGGLRFYIGSATDAIFERIEAAEKQAAVTCEYCGNPGTLRPGGWLKTLCDECQSKR